VSAGGGAGRAAEALPGPCHALRHKCPRLPAAPDHVLLCYTFGAGCQLPVMTTTRPRSQRMAAGHAAPGHSRSARQPHNCWTAAPTAMDGWVKDGTALASRSHRRTCFRWLRWLRCNPIGSSGIVLQVLQNAGNDARIAKPDTSCCNVVSYVARDCLAAASSCCSRVISAGGATSASGTTCLRVHSPP